MLQADEDDTEGAQKLNDELMKMEYNYISEDTVERKILFEVCTLNNEQTDEEKRLFHDSWQAFDQLFNWKLTKHCEGNS